MRAEPRALQRDEQELLLAGSRAEADLESARALPALVRREIDWSRLRAAANAHGVLPLLYWNLLRCASEQAPTLELERLRREFETGARRSLRLAGELLAVLATLQAEGLAAAPYKGPALAQLLYDNLTLRQFSDIEILVRRQDVLAVKRLLLARGYHASNPMAAGQEAAYLGSECEYNFFHPERALLLEVHWQIVPRYLGFRLDERLLWDRLVPLEIGGRRLLVQAPQRQILMLALHHGGKHHWRRLGWIGDLARIIQLPGIDWSEALEDARRSGCLRVLCIGLHLARELLLRAALPPAAERLLGQDPQAAGLAAAWSRRLFDWSGAEPHRFFLDLRIRDRTADRIDYAWKALLIPTEGDRQLLSLPRGLIALYYLVRPLRLSVCYARRWWRRWTGTGMASACAGGLLA